jgi:hypothetical protein
MRAPGMDAEEVRRLGYGSVDLIADPLSGMPKRFVFTEMGPADWRTFLDRF